MLRILHIEDDQRYLSMVKEALAAKDGIVLEQVVTLRSALERLRDKNLEPIDALLVDLILPDAHEMEAVTALRGFNLPLVVLTGNAFPDNLERAAEAGADDYIIKYQLNKDEIGSQLIRRIRFALKRYVKHEQKIETAVASISKPPFVKRNLSASALEALKPFICAIK